MEVVNWPASLISPSQTSWHLKGGSRGTGIGLNNREQFIYTENRYWTGTLSLPEIFGTALPELLAAVDDIAGQLNIIKLPLFNPFTVTKNGSDADFWRALGVSETAISDGFERFSDGTTFTDGTGFSLPSGDNPTALLDAVVGSSTIKFGGVIGTVLSVGAIFTHNGFMYRVAENTNGLIRFNPPLRQGILKGEAILVDKPFIYVRFASNDEANILINYCKWGSPVSVNFIEAFER
ncbi:MAG: hypothetical protein JKY93_03365 [Gammaproteobacteria bacterium]|nr:hypothetical protein [Gammaproteobacteria bacterium]